MADTSDSFNPPRPVFHWLRHPVLLLLLALLLFFVGKFLYRLVVPRAAKAITPAEPNGEWVGSFTIDGQYWYPAVHGDTPGSHRFGAIRFQLETGDSFLDTHRGPGVIDIAGESVSRPIRVSSWELRPDGSVTFDIVATPDLFSNSFSCEAEGSQLTCKNSDPLKPRLTLHPGTDADAAALLQQARQQEATVPLPAPPAKVPSMDDFERDLHSKDGARSKR